MGLLRGEIALSTRCSEDRLPFVSCPEREAGRGSSGFATDVMLDDLERLCFKGFLVCSIGVFSDCP